MRNVREYFALAQRKAESVALTTSRRTLLHGYFEAAERRLEAAAVLVDCGLSRDALMSYREACVQLVQGYFCLNQAPPREGGEELRATLDRACELLREEPSHKWAALGRCLPELCALDWKTLDALPNAETKLRCQELAALTRDLSARLEPKPVGRLNAIRNLRIAMAVLALAAVPLGLELWRLSPRNLAYGKRVFASSMAPNSQPQNLVDDDTYGPPAFQSTPEASPWLAIDLGRVAMVSDASVFLRNDCCGDSSIPMVFEVSEDGKDYRVVATKSDPFTLFKPWIVKSISSAVRFVRVRSTNPGVLVLTEVLVYGRW